MSKKKNIQNRAERLLPMVVSATLCMAAVLTGCGEKKQQTTVVPSITPSVTKEAEPTPTKAPATIPDAPFAMVTPIPQKQVKDIVGTMSVEEYPVVDGSTATIPLSEALFMAATGESEEVAAKEVKHTKTTNSYLRLYEKEADLLIVYEPSESIVERMESEPLCIKPIGLDALVFLANTANPVESLTTEQLVDIYSGKINNWSEVGGKNQELLAFQRPTGSGSQSLMQKLVMKEVEMVTGDNVFRYSTMSDILEGMLSYNGEDNTLGYSVFYYANNMYVEKDLKLLGVNGVVPSTQTIYDGSYDLINAFYAVIRTDEPEDSNARKLFDWLTGEAGQQMVLDLGYVPVLLPDGADISDVAVKQPEQNQVLATKSLEEGQYFVFLNPQNWEAEFYYGDAVIYDNDWNEVANFYNVTLDYNVQGIYENRYLPVGQIRQNTEGEQVVRYGVYDLQTGTYTVSPSYTDLVIVDADRNYYAVPQNEEEENWMNYKIINATGETVLPFVVVDDWITISKFGSGYLEYDYDYETGEMQYRVYNENLQLCKVFCENAASIPDDADRIEGVEYYFIDGGFFVNEEAEVLLTKEMFLERYGDGSDMECELPGYGGFTISDWNCFGVKYQGTLYLVDENLDLIQTMDASQLEDIPGATFYPTFYTYYNYAEGGSIYKTYEGTPLRLQNGMTAQGVCTDEKEYLLYAKQGTTLYVEEYLQNGEVCQYEYTIPQDSEFDVTYEGNHAICISIKTKETMRTDYGGGVYQDADVWEHRFYYGTSLLCAKKGLNVYAWEQEDGTILWSVLNGTVLYVESESIYEEQKNGVVCYDYVLVDKDRILYEIDNAQRYSSRCLQFFQGNYFYAIGTDGTEYIKALSAHMALD